MVVSAGDHTIRTESSSTSLLHLGLWQEGDRFSFEEALKVIPGIIPVDSLDRVESLLAFTIWSIAPNLT